MQPVPGPRFRALTKRVVENHGDIDLLRLVLRHARLERLRIAGDNGETFRRNTIALRTISVTPEGDAQLAFVVRRQDNPARYVLGQSLLKDSSVGDFNRE